VRSEFRRLAGGAGVRPRFAPRQLRHAHLSAPALAHHLLRHRPGRRSIVRLLRDDAPQHRLTLADDAHGLLTVAALTYRGWLVAWLQSLAFTAAAVPPIPDARREAQDRLARAAEFVPATVGLRTLVIEGPPRRPPSA
jgi:hypothetical protein